MKKIEKFKAKVNAGAAFLSIVNPKWYKNIDLKRLNLAKMNVCVLGELYDGYENGQVCVGINNSSSEALGFDTENGVDYPLLTKLWKSKIRSLLRRK